MFGHLPGNQAVWSLGTFESILKVSSLVDGNLTTANYPLKIDSRESTYAEACPRFLYSFAELITQNSSDCYRLAICSIYVPAT